MKHSQHLHNNLNIFSTCRTCLKNLNPIHHNIFATSGLKKKFTICTSMSIEPDDGFPPSLCELCHNKINDFYNFQLMCISSLKRFQECINLEQKSCKFEVGFDDTNKYQAEITKLEIMMLEEAKKESEEEYFQSDKDESLSEIEMSESNEGVESNNEGSESDERVETDEGVETDTDRGEQSHEEEEDQTILEHMQTGQHAGKINFHKNQNMVYPFISTKIIIRLKRNAYKGIKAYTCSYCNKSFNSACNIKYHERTHTGEKPHKCNSCQQMFTRPSSLKRHTMFHCIKAKQRFKLGKVPKSLESISRRKRRNLHYKKRT